MNKEQAEQWDKEYQEAQDKVMGFVVPGKKYRIPNYEGAGQSVLIHILSIVDGEYFVYKYWWKRRKRWHYHVAHFVHFYYMLDKMEERK